MLCDLDTPEGRDDGAVMWPSFPDMDALRAGGTAVGVCVRGTVAAHRRGAERLLPSSAHRTAADSQPRLAHTSIVAAARFIV